MKNTFQIAAIAVAFVGAAGVGLIGCGEGDDDDMNGPDGGTTLYALKTGTYVVQSASDVDDKCDIGVDKPYNATTMSGGLIGAPLQLMMETNAQGMNTGKINLGSIQGMPPEPALGSGNISSNRGTLESDTMISADAPSMCKFQRKTTSMLTMTDNYTFNLKVTRTMSNPMACTFTETCTSTWTWKVHCPTCSTGATPAGR